MPISTLNNQIYPIPLLLKYSHSQKSTFLNEIHICQSIVFISRLQPDLVSPPPLSGAVTKVYFTKNVMNSKCTVEMSFCPVLMIVIMMTYQSDNCIVCKQVNPDLSKKPYLVIVTWSMCDKCNGWVLCHCAHPFRSLEEVIPSSAQYVSTMKSKLRINTIANSVH